MTHDLTGALKETLRDIPTRWIDSWHTAEILGEYVGNLTFSAWSDAIGVNYEYRGFAVIDSLCLCKVRDAIRDIVRASATVGEWTDNPWSLAEFLDDDDYRVMCHFDLTCQYVDIVSHTVACHDGFGTCAVAS